MNLFCQPFLHMYLTPPHGWWWNLAAREVCLTRLGQVLKSDRGGAVWPADALKG